jgi:hypothetical protein
LADTLQSDVHNYESRTAPTETSSIKTYGTAGLGLDLTAEGAWPTLSQIFVAGGKAQLSDTPGRPPCLQVADVHRLPNTSLCKHPVDLLVLGNLDAGGHAAWLKRIQHATTPPRLLFEFWPENALFSEEGPVSKGQVTKWDDAQYHTTCRLINATQVGGVVDRRWLVVIRHRNDWKKQESQWPALGPEVASPMNNCLRPSGIPHAAYRRRTKSDPNWSNNGEPIPHSETHPMPAWPGRVIETPRGVRRLLNDELARGQGAPKSWLADTYPRSETVRITVAVHLLEYLSELMSTAPPTKKPSSNDTRDDIGNPFEPPEDDEHPPFSWNPPDLAPRSAWTRERTFSLIQAALKYDDPGALIEEGMKMLRRHRTNYTAEGTNPTHLQLMWWEFPPESWNELREGCSMNFLKPPRECITPNSEMTAEQVTIAEEFVEELVSLGVLIHVKPGEIVMNGPLFCLSKPGQWRILSDIRRGGQNEAVGSDPTVFP